MTKRIEKRWFMGLAIAGLAALTACGPVPTDGPKTQKVQTAPKTPAKTRTSSSPMTPKSFFNVVRRLEPTVERECLRRRTQNINCDFKFVVDDTPGAEPNAFQTVDSRGRPIIGFTASLVSATHNSDEIAFVVGHEASHHVLNHLNRKSGATTAGAIILGGIAAAYGADIGVVDTAQQIGATVGSRVYSKEWELEADYLGAIMALNAGFDPVNGSHFFERLPDPGNHILGTHPARASRLAQVQRAVADVQSGKAR